MFTSGSPFQQAHLRKAGQAKTEQMDTALPQRTSSPRPELCLETGTSQKQGALGGKPEDYLVKPC